MKLVHLPRRTSTLVRRAQDAIEQRVKLVDESEVLQPSLFWVRATMWSLMGTAVCGIGWLSVAQTEEIVWPRQTRATGRGQGDTEMGGRRTNTGQRRREGSSRTGSASTGF